MLLSEDLIFILEDSPANREAQCTDAPVFVGFGDKKDKMESNSMSKNTFIFWEHKPSQTFCTQRRFILWSESERCFSPRADPQFLITYTQCLFFFFRVFDGLIAHQLTRLNVRPERHSLVDLRARFRRWMCPFGGFSADLWTLAHLSDAFHVSKFS